MALLHVIVLVSSWCDYMHDMNLLYNYVTKILHDEYVVDCSIMFMYNVLRLLMIGLLIICDVVVFICTLH